MSRANNKRMNLIIWSFLACGLSACGPKQHQIQNQNAWQSEGEPFLTSCNQLDFDSVSSPKQMQISANSGSEDHAIVKFSENPLADDDTPIHITKWTESVSSSTLVQMRARVITNAGECFLTDGYESGTLTTARVNYLKSRMQTMASLGGCGMSTSGNFFSKIEFLIKDLDENWKGLSIFKGSSAATSVKVTSGLLPPFYLQYSVYAAKRPTALHEFHPLYMEADKTQEQLESLEASYCSLF